MSSRYLRTQRLRRLADAVPDAIPAEQGHALCRVSPEIADQLATKIPGDQRENILAVWLGSLESQRRARSTNSRAARRSKKPRSGDYFTHHERARQAKRSRHTYTARRVVIAIGLRGAPNKLRLPERGHKVTVIDEAASSQR